MMGSACGTGIISQLKAHTVTLERPWILLLLLGQLGLAPASRNIPKTPWCTGITPQLIPHTEVVAVEGLWAPW